MENSNIFECLKLFEKMDIQQIVSKFLTKKTVKNIIVGISVFFFGVALIELLLCLTNLFLLFWVEAIFNVIFFLASLTTAYFGMKTGKSRDIPEQDRKFSMWFAICLLIIILGSFVYVIVVLISGSLVSYFEDIYTYLPAVVTDSVGKGWFVLWGVVMQVMCYTIAITFCIACFAFSYLNIRHISQDIDGGYNIVKTTDEDEELDDVVDFEDDEEIREESLQIHNEEMRFDGEESSEGDGGKVEIVNVETKNK